jgi:hypothetical protein
MISTTPTTAAGAIGIVDVFLESENDLPEPTRALLESLRSFLETIDLAGPVGGQSSAWQLGADIGAR